MSAAGPLDIVILHGVADASRPDEQDTLDQVRQVSASLARLGHGVKVEAIGLDLSALRSIPPGSLVFNLVEAIRGDGRLIHLAPAALEHLGHAFTGAGSAAMVVSSSKTLSKPVLGAAGLAVPESLLGAGASSGDGLYIVKSEWEDASFGIDAGSVVDGARAASEIAARQARYGGTWFAERFIDGREFNISVLGHGDGARVLPPAEIVFEGFPEGKPRIVDYEAKWDASSFAYRNTVRRFLDVAAERELVDRLVDTAKRAYWAMDLRDYGRVDIRLASDGTPCVLEVNANPCLSADAGFAAAAAEAGLDFDAMIAAIVGAARKRVGTSAAAQPTPAAAKAGPSVHSGVSWRFEAAHADIASVRTLVERTGFFTPAEVAIAAELVEERIAKGPASGYEFVLAEDGGRLLGYTCFGLIPGSDISWDLYWIAVDPEQQGRGLGRKLLTETERLIRAAGGRQLYADTSSSPHYAPTRAYYQAAGFREAARLDDFYRAGDGKVIFGKKLDT